ncbi:MAG: amidase [Deltaproteobacteria bacterium]|nr:amidase [Deltaproteobacteria bacterium]
MNTLQPIARVTARLQAGEISSVELVQQILARAADPTGEGQRIFTRVYADAVDQAAEQDRRRARGEIASPLAGVPISIKDLFDVAGETTLAGSKALVGSPPAGRDAEVVAWLKQAGAVIIGKTNMTELAFSGLGLNPHYGTPRNPWDRARGRIPGGSSSGAAVSVTDGMAVAAIGTDTGGSVRIPAALCGLVGFKPTAARVPREGVLPLSGTLDSVGPIAPSVACCALLDAVLAGERVEELQSVPLGSLRFAAPQRYVLDGMDSQVATAFEQAKSRLAAAGAQIVEIPFAEVEELPELNAKGSFSAAEAWAWHKGLIESRSELYDPRVLTRILRGKDISAEELATLHQRRADLIQRAQRVTAQFDALLMPTVPVVAPELGGCSALACRLRRFSISSLPISAAVHPLRQAQDRLRQAQGERRKKCRKTETVRAELVEARAANGSRWREGDRPC